jgi:hypothetical protein
MADGKTVPGGTANLPDNPELANLKEREATIVTEIERLEKMDANKMSHSGHDFNEVKNREIKHLAEIRAAIAELEGAAN